MMDLGASAQLVMLKAMVPNVLMLMPVRSHHAANMRRAKTSHHLLRWMPPVECAHATHLSLGMGTLAHVRLVLSHKVAIVLTLMLALSRLVQNFRDAPTSRVLQLPKTVTDELASATEGLNLQTQVLMASFATTLMRAKLHRVVKTSLAMIWPLQRRAMKTAASALACQDSRSTRMAIHVLI